MARWLVCDSLYRPEAFFASHLDSYSHYLREAGEKVETVCWNFRGMGSMPVLTDDDRFDVAFVLDNYVMGASVQAEKRVAQVAAICSPMPWEVREVDGSPAYDLMLSSLRWMVDEARKHGQRAEWMPLAFDTRALVCGMNVKERDIPCLFVGTRDANHRKREEVLTALGDLVIIAPPTFGRAYFELLHRARSVVHVGAEWSRGERNAMRVWETVGCRARLITDGKETDEVRYGLTAETVRDFVQTVQAMSNCPPPSASEQSSVLVSDTYVQRIPRLIEIARSL